MSGVKMHSWVTRNPPCDVRSTGPDTLTAVPAAASSPPPTIATQLASTLTNGLLYTGGVRAKYATTSSTVNSMKRRAAPLRPIAPKPPAPPSVSVPCRLIHQ